MRCIFCEQEVPKGGSNNDILHHIFPKCLVSDWIRSKEVPNQTKALLNKSKVPLCRHCHRIFHILISHLIELLKESEIPDIPPDTFAHMLRSANAKYGVRKTL